MPCASKVGRPGSIRAISIVVEVSEPFLLPHLRPTLGYRFKCKDKSLDSSKGGQPWRQAEAIVFAANSLLYQTPNSYGNVKFNLASLRTQSHALKQWCERVELRNLDDGSYCDRSTVPIFHESILSHDWGQKILSSRPFVSPVMKNSLRSSIIATDSGIFESVRSVAVINRRSLVNNRAYTTQPRSHATYTQTEFLDQHEREQIKASQGSPKLSRDNSITRGKEKAPPETKNTLIRPQIQTSSGNDGIGNPSPYSSCSPGLQDVRNQQLIMLREINHLERQLGTARQRLKASLDENEPLSLQRAVRHESSLALVTTSMQISLTKEDYVNMVDLYYYTAQKETISSPMHSPNPVLFKESAGEELSKRIDVRNEVVIDLESQLDIAIDPNFYAKTVADLRAYESQFRKESFRSNSLLEPLITALLQERSSARKLFKLYQKFPKPGVAYLPTSAVRLLLYRMSTHSDKRSEANLVRYLALIDDMQEANLPITISEWSSAIYLAGRAFWQVTEYDLSRSIDMWKRMEQQAEVRASHVTFNILFDIAVKAKKYVFAQKIIKEMFDRGLHLNRLGRVSFIWYQGWLGDGDAVRRAYRDFVDAGEIVDTLVLNCVMVSLIRAQEPAAAEQIYERMKALAIDVRRYLDRKQQVEATEHERDTLPSVVQYPPPGSGKLENEYASNRLGRVLLTASKLATKRPDLHRRLQASMPMVPDETTFRILIDQYAVTAGEIDRLSVVLNDMTDLGISMNNLYFRLIFRGFYFHGGSKYSHWTPRLLTLVWQACLEGLNTFKLRKDKTNGRNKYGTKAVEGRDEEDDEEEDEEKDEEEGIEWTENDGPRRKSPKAIDETAIDIKPEPVKETGDEPDQDDLKDGVDESDQPWRRFIDEFTESTVPPGSATSRLSNFRRSMQSSFFTSPTFSGDVKPRSDDNPFTPPNSSNSSLDEAGDLDPASVMSLPGALKGISDYKPSRHIQPSLALIKWILRAYTKVTGRRERVEDVWWECKAVWKPKNESEKDAILSILEGCLRTCDRRNKY